MKIYSLSWILSEFADKSGTYNLLLRISEKAYHVYSTSFIKEAYKILVVKENLTPTERRFFIGMNIGLPIFNYRISLLDRVIYNYLLFEERNFEIIFNFLHRPDSRGKIGVNVQGRARFLLSFIIFLNFYPIWSYTVKSYDRERKRFNHGDISINLFDEFISNEIEADAIPSADSKKKAPKRITYYQDLATFELNDLFQKLFNGRDKEILIKHFIERVTQEELAEEYKISQARISNIINKAINKLRESNEMKNIYGNMIKK